MPDISTAHGVCSNSKKTEIRLTTVLLFNFERIVIVNRRLKQHIFNSIIKCIVCLLTRPKAQCVNKTVGLCMQKKKMHIKNTVQLNFNRSKHSTIAFGIHFDGPIFSVRSVVLSIWLFRCEIWFLIFSLAVSKTYYPRQRKYK